MASIHADEDGSRFSLSESCNLVSAAMASLAVELEVLRRSLYRTHSQHRASLHYRPLRQAKRHLELLTMVDVHGQFIELLRLKEASDKQHSTDSKQKQGNVRTSSEASPQSIKLIVHRLSGASLLLGKTTGYICTAARFLGDLLSLSFFMPLALTLLACLARCHALVLQLSRQVDLATKALTSQSLEKFHVSSPALQPRESPPIASLPKVVDCVPLVQALPPPEWPHRLQAPSLGAAVPPVQPLTPAPNAAPPVQSEPLAEPLPPADTLSLVFQTSPLLDSHAFVEFVSPVRPVPGLNSSRDSLTPEDSFHFVDTKEKAENRDSEATRSDAVNPADMLGQCPAETETDGVRDKLAESPGSDGGHWSVERMSVRFRATGPVFGGERDSSNSVSPLRPSVANGNRESKRLRVVTGEKDEITEEKAGRSSAGKNKGVRKPARQKRPLDMDHIFQQLLH